VRVVVVVITSLRFVRQYEGFCRLADLASLGVWHSIVGLNGEDVFYKIFNQRADWSTQYVIKVRKCHFSNGETEPISAVISYSELALMQVGLVAMYRSEHFQFYHISSDNKSKSHYQAISGGLYRVIDVQAKLLQNARTIRRVY
jgi:hypothetical protein